jgi:hypothetical protein
MPGLMGILHPIPPHAKAVCDLSNAVKRVSHVCLLLVHPATLCMQVASIFLHPGSTSPVWVVASMTPIKNGSGPACGGLPQDAYKVSDFPVFDRVYGVSGEDSQERAARPANSGRGQEKGGGKAAISGGGVTSPRLFSNELFGS